MEPEKQILTDSSNDGEDQKSKDGALGQQEDAGDSGIWFPKEPGKVLPASNLV